MTVLLTEEDHAESSALNENSEISKYKAKISDAKTNTSLIFFTTLSDMGCTIFDLRVACFSLNLFINISI